VYKNVFSRKRRRGSATHGRPLYHSDITDYDYYYYYYYYSQRLMTFLFRRSYLRTYIIMRTYLLTYLLTYNTIQYNTIITFVERYLRSVQQR